GDNSFGELGNGTTLSSLTPIAVSGGLAFASVSGLGETNCGVTPGGAAYCWGYNLLGNLGIGTTSGPQQCVYAGTSLACSTTPVAVSGGLTFAAVSPGADHTCGVTPSGAAYCWGDDCYGELGSGSSACSPAPVAVSGGLTFAAVSAVCWRTCGVTPSGAAYCWGENYYGELGNGTTMSSLTPVAVSGGLTFAAVGAGIY